MANDGQGEISNFDVDKFSCVFCSDADPVAWNFTSSCYNFSLLWIV